MASLRFHERTAPRVGGVNGGRCPKQEAACQGLKGQPIPAWGIAPGNRPIVRWRAEGPVHHAGPGDGTGFQPCIPGGAGGSWGDAPGWDGTALWA